MHILMNFLSHHIHPDNAKDYLNLSHLRKPDTGMLDLAASRGGQFLFISSINFFK